MGANIESSTNTSTITGYHLGGTVCSFNSGTISTLTSSTIQGVRNLIMSGTDTGFPIGEFQITSGTGPVTVTNSLVDANSFIFLNREHNPVLSGGVYVSSVGSGQFTAASGSAVASTITQKYLVLNR